MTMKNLFKLLICTILLTCGSDDESENIVINLPANYELRVYLNQINLY